MSSEPNRTWSDSDLASDAVTKKDLVTFLQENASSQFLLEHKLNGKLANVVKNAKKDALVVAYNALFETRSFRTESDIPAELVTKEPKASAESSTASQSSTAAADEPLETPKYTKSVLKKGNKLTYPKKGDTVYVKYTGKLEDGKVFDTNEDKKSKNQTLNFKVGTNRVIRGWDEALLTMSKGERAKLTIEPEWAYGKKGMPDAGIPPNSTLIFEVELINVD